jgi:5,5'-dehydrodivanillate O-demethylase
MLTTDANKLLTQVGPGTPMGNVLRRYWHPVATAIELAREPVLAVELLGENLALYRSPNGDLGLTAERCPHRGASMAYGIPEDGGLRCPYHGWKFSAEGQCLEMPAEPEDSTFKHRVRIPAYPVQEMGGLIWAYLGPAPVPLLPRYDLFVVQDRIRDIGLARLPCNWLQIMENSVDPVHFEYLHGIFGNYVMRRKGLPEASTPHKHERIAFDVFPHGIMKRRLLEGESEDSDDWRVGHPLLFPNILAVNSKYGPMFQIRVPLNDHETRHYWYQVKPLPEGQEPPIEIPIWDNPFQAADGKLVTDNINAQDMMAWITQGPITDRTAERLGSSDKGIILLRSLLREQIEKVARGEDPLGVIRDPAINEPMIELPREGQTLKAFGLNYEIMGAVEHFRA